MATRPSPSSWNRFDQRFRVEGSSWPSAVLAAAARSHVSPMHRRVNPFTITARPYRWRGTTRSSKSVTTLLQPRHRQRCWWTTCRPPNSTSRRGRWPCGVHRLPPHLGQPSSGRDATLGAVRHQPSEPGRHAQLRRLPPFRGGSLFPAQLATDHWGCNETWVVIVPGAPHCFVVPAASFDQLRQPEKSEPSRTQSAQ
jgi:hypothetical protein